jgi:hypothetical protein
VFPQVEIGSGEDPLLCAGGRGEPLPEADAIVSTSFFKNGTLQVADLGPVRRVIGVDRKVIHRGSGVGLHGGADSALPTAGPLPPFWRDDDHYGLGTQRCIE